MSLTPPSSPAALRYAAFISYSSLDRARGEALQQALEAFRLPAPLRGRDFGRGPLAKRLGSVFRDRWDADASVDLGAELRAALEASDALIVLCSPASARSRWVGEEILSFKRLGRADRLFPVLIDGLPQAHDAALAPAGAFHPALFLRWSESLGQFERELHEPLAPDLRESGDGLRFSVLKLVAALTGVPLTLLTQRQAEAERRERNIARAIAAAMAVLALGATVAGWASWRSAALARERLENAVEMAARRIDDAAAFQDRYGVPSDVIRLLLDGARQDFDELTADAAEAPTLALQQVRLDRLLAGHYEAVGDGDQQQALARRALERLARVPVARQWSRPSTWLARLPAESAIAVERLQALSAQAQAQATRGNAPVARQTLESMMLAADALLAREPGPVQRSLAAQARAQRARLAYEAGQLQLALADLQAASRVLEGGPAGPNDLDAASRVSGSSAAGATLGRGGASSPGGAPGSSSQVGPTPASGVAGPTAPGGLAEQVALRSEQAEMLLELGRHAQALQLQESVVAALEPASSASPELRRTLATALARRGDMRLAATRELALARADYLAALGLLTELSALDSARADFKRDLSLAQERVGDAHLQAGDVPAARAAYLACLALRRELALRNPAQVEWRRDLSVALERLGDIEAQQGRAGAAEAAFTEALAIRQAAHAAAPDDAVAIRDLAVLWMRIGRARQPSSRAAPQSPTAPAEAAARPATRSVARSAAPPHTRSDESPSARAQPAAPEPAALRPRAAGAASIEGVSEAYAKAITLMQPLAEGSAADHRWRRDLAVAHAERGEALRLAGRTAAATADLRRALAMVSGLRQQDPNDAQLLADETWLRARLSR